SGRSLRLRSAPQSPERFADAVERFRGGDYHAACLWTRRGGRMLEGLGVRRYGDRDDSRPGFGISAHFGCDWGADAIACDETVSALCALVVEVEDARGFLNVGGPLDAIYGGRTDPLALTGYGWLTILSQAQVRRLGGAKRLGERTPGTAVAITPRS